MLSNPVYIYFQFCTPSVCYKCFSLLSDLSAEITYLTKHVGREWKMFARSLGLSDGDIDCIEDDYARNLREQIRQSLNYWKNENRTEATKESLIRALRQAQLNLLADNIESEKY